MEPVELTAASAEGYGQGHAVRPSAVLVAQHSAVQHAARASWPVRGWCHPAWAGAYGCRWLGRRRAVFGRPGADGVPLGIFTALHWGWGERRGEGGRGSAAGRGGVCVSPVAGMRTPGAELTGSDSGIGGTTAPKGLSDSTHPAYGAQGPGRFGAWTSAQCRPHAAACTCLSGAAFAAVHRRLPFATAPTVLYRGALLSPRRRTRKVRGVGFQPSLSHPRPSRPPSRRSPPRRRPTR